MKIRYIAFFVLLILAVGLVFNVSCNVCFASVSDDEGWDDWDEEGESEHEWMSFYKNYAVINVVQYELSQNREEYVVHVEYDIKENEEEAAVVRIGKIYYVVNAGFENLRIRDLSCDNGKCEGSIPFGENDNTIEFVISLVTSTGNFTTESFKKEYSKNFAKDYPVISKDRNLDEGLIGDGIDIVSTSVFYGNKIIYFQINHEPYQDNNQRYALFFASVQNATQMDLSNPKDQKMFLCVTQNHRPVDAEEAEGLHGDVLKGKGMAVLEISGARVTQNESLSGMKCYETAENTFTIPIRKEYIIKDESDLIQIRGGTFVIDPSSWPTDHSYLNSVYLRSHRIEIDK